MRKRSPVSWKAEDIMEVACRDYCYFHECRELIDSLEEHCNQCQLKLMVHLSVKN